MLKTFWRCGLCVAIGFGISIIVVIAIGAILHADRQSRDFIMSGVMGFLCPTATLLALDRLYLKPRYAALPLYGSIAAIAALTVLMLLLGWGLPQSFVTTLITNGLYFSGITMIGLYVALSFPSQDDDGLYQMFT